MRSKMKEMFKSTFKAISKVKDIPSYLYDDLECTDKICIDYQNTTLNKEEKEMFWLFIEEMIEDEYKVGYYDGFYDGHEEGLLEWKDYSYEPWDF